MLFYLYSTFRQLRAFGLFRGKVRSYSNPGWVGLSLLYRPGLYPLGERIVFTQPFFEFPFGRGFVQYSGEHRSLSRDFDLSLRPCILTGGFDLFFTLARKRFSI